MKSKDMPIIDFKIVAYLDILGFKERINTNIQSGINLLKNYQLILKELKDEHYIDGFDFFLPFSDSIFIQASDASIFIKQLSKFLIHCFECDANNYRYPENNNKPHEATMHEHELKNGNVIVNDVKVDLWPLLFRGGIGYGESYIVEMDAIICKPEAKVKNIIGKAIIDAYNLESKGKGPRLFCDINFYNQLDDKTKRYCKKENDIFEILWPIFNFIEDNTTDFESNKIMNIILPVINLYKAYNKESFGVHYKEFLKLTICSVIRFFEIKNEKEIGNIQGHINSILKKNEIDPLTLIC